jgi:hypothetical protein
MQKWEYLFLTVFRVGDVWKVGIVNGKEIPKWIQGVSLYDFVNERGEEGWELISASFSPIFTDLAHVDSEDYRLVMKRPKG